MAGPIYPAAVGQLQAAAQNNVSNSFIFKALPIIGVAVFTALVAEGTVSLSKFDIQPIAKLLKANTTTAATTICVGVALLVTLLVGKRLCGKSPSAQVVQQQHHTEAKMLEALRPTIAQDNRPPQDAPTTAQVNIFPQAAPTTTEDTTPPQDAPPVLHTTSSAVTKKTPKKLSSEELSKVEKLRRNFVAVGPTRSGKSTLPKTLENPYNPTGPAKLYSETRAPECREVTMGPFTAEIIDTCGLRDRALKGNTTVTDQESLKAIDLEVKNKFGGYEKVDRIFFTLTHPEKGGFWSGELGAIADSLRHFDKVAPHVEKTLLITHAEELDDARINAAVEQMRSSKHADVINRFHQAGNILSFGAFPNQENTDFWLDCDKFFAATERVFVRREELIKKMCGDWIQARAESDPKLKEKIINAFSFKDCTLQKDIEETVSNLIKEKEANLAKKQEELQAIEQRRKTEERESAARIEEKRASLLRDMQEAFKKSDPGSKRPTSEDFNTAINAFSENETALLARIAGQESSLSSEINRLGKEIERLKNSFEEAQPQLVELFKDWEAKEENIRTT